MGDGKLASLLTAVVSGLTGRTFCGCVGVKKKVLPAEESGAIEFCINGHGSYCIDCRDITRTWLDVWFSGLNGAVVKAIVSRDRKKFIAKAIIEFGLMMVSFRLFFLFCLLLLVG